MFVGRHAERALFADGIAHDPGPDGSRRLIHVHGVAGVGKSTLLRHWQGTARSHGALTAMVDASAVCGVAEAMQAIGAELGFRAGRLLTPNDTSAGLATVQSGSAARTLPAFLGACCSRNARQMDREVA